MRIGTASSGPLLARTPPRDPAKAGTGVYCYKFCCSGYGQ